MILQISLLCYLSYLQNLEYLPWRCRADDASKQRDRQMTARFFDTSKHLGRTTLRLDSIVSNYLFPIDFDRGVPVTAVLCFL